MTNVMRKAIWCAVLVVAGLAGRADGQTIQGDRFVLSTGPCTESSGSGAPSGGATCDFYKDTATGDVYTRDSGGTWHKVNTYGTVTSVALTPPGKITVSGSPITTSGTLALAWNWTAHTGLVGNGTGTPAEIAGCTNGVWRWSASSSDPICDTNPTITSLTTTGGVTLGTDELPNLGYTSNLGSLTKKFLTLHAAELWVETLVAQSTMATIGGRILVTATNELSVDAAAVDTTLHWKYNNFSNGDRIYCEANNALEFMAVTSSAGGSSGNYTYTVTRNLDGSGADAWPAGTACADTGQTDSGWWDIYSVNGVKSNTEAGPTIVANVRNSSTYNDWSPRIALGRLDGLFGYTSTTCTGSKPCYGAAFGIPTGSWIKIDPTNGIRIGNNTTTKIQLDASGNASFASGNTTIDQTGITVSPSSTSFVYNKANGYNFTMSGSDLLGVGGWANGSDQGLRIESLKASGSSQTSNVNLLAAYTANSFGEYTARGADANGSSHCGADSTGSEVCLEAFNSLGLNSQVYIEAVNSGGGTGRVYLSATNQVRFNAGTGLTMTQNTVVYPGAVTGLSDYQTSYYLASSSTYGLYMNTSLATNGGYYFADATHPTGTSILIDTGDRIRFGSNSVFLGWDGTQFFPFDDNAKHLGNGTFRWADVFAANGTIQTSDARQKKNVKDTTFGAAFVAALRPVDFEWTDAKMNPDHMPPVHHGFLAQDVAKIDPTFGGLHFDDGGVADGLNYSAFVPVLVKAFQELNARVAALEKKGGQ